MSKHWLALTAVVAVCSVVVGSSTALADTKRATGSFAEFRACMKAKGAPAFGHRLSADERAALKQALAACRGLLPKLADGRGPRAKHKFVRPSAAQIAAFKTCMAEEGFSASRPDLRDPAVRKALRAALKRCLPLLKPKPTSTG
jgi:hypothetical protein